MAVFRFSLQAVLDIRESLVQRCERELEDAKRLHRELRDLLMQERDRYFAERDELNAHLQHGEFQKISMYEISLESRKGRMLLLVQNIRDAQADVDLREQNLVQARKNFKAVELLKDRRLAEFTQQQEMKERKHLDEQATMRRARQELENKKARDS